MANKENSETDGKMIKINLSQNKTLYVFDFDDTIAETEEAVLVRDKKTGKIIDHLHSQTEADNYILKPNLEYDFSEFVNVEGAKEIELVTSYLRKLAADGKKIIVLSARQHQARHALKKYLKSINISTNSITFACVDGSKNKYEYLKKAIKKIKPKDKVVVFEDTLKNIQMMLPLEKDYPDLTFDFVHVHIPETDEELGEANRNQYFSMNSAAQYGTEKFQRTLKRLHPRMKRNLIGKGGNKYSVKGVKKHKDFKRSKSAPPGGA